MEVPKTISTVKEMLEDMNLQQYQKLPDFHILKVEDHLEEVSQYANLIADNVFEIGYGIDYDIDLKIDNVHFNGQKGHLTFLSPGQHFYMDIQEGKLNKEGTTYLIYFSVSFLPIAATNYSIIQKFPCFNKHYAPVYYIEDEVEKKYLDLFEKMYTEFQNLDENSVEIIRSYLIIMLFELKRLPYENAILSRKISRPEELCYQFENLIKTTTKKRQKLDYYANKLNVSTIYLSECIKKTTGHTPKKVITDYAIMEAKDLLINTNKTVEQIASLIGFEDASNFTNFFKKNTSSTPIKFRKQV